MIKFTYEASLVSLSEIYSNINNNDLPPAGGTAAGDLNRVKDWGVDDRRFKMPNGVSDYNTNNRQKHYQQPRPIITIWNPAESLVGCTKCKDSSYDEKYFSVQTETLFTLVYFPGATPGALWNPAGIQQNP